MAQPPSQQQHQYANLQRPFSPPQSTGSPGTPQQYSQPPNKRQKLSPNPPSQPASPYTGSPYGMSPSASTGASPHFSNVQLPTHAYSTPYGNGHTNNVNIQPSQPQPNHQVPLYQSPLGHPNTNPPIGQQGTYNNFTAPSQTPGTMGPPSKPIEKKEDADMIDVLAGTGINLQEEEQYMFQISSSFGSGIQGSQSGTNSSGHSFTQFPPGNESSFYGAGPANAAAEAPNTKSQEDYHKKLAEKAWADAVHNLAASQASEFNCPFLSTARLHQKMDDMAGKHGVQLNRVNRNMMGQFAQPRDFNQSNVAIQTANGPGTVMSAVNGTFIHPEALLSDQVALISLACKHRLRTLLEESVKLGRGRQTGSHGIIPEDWADVAVEANISSSNSVVNGEVRAGWESAHSPHSNPVNLSPSKTEIVPAPLLDSNKKPSGKLQASNEVVAALRSSATKERDLEELRLKKRQNRTTGDNTPRQGSVAPGTPGSVAPDPTEKAPTKKELKKKLGSKATEAANHAATNVTTNQFLGGNASGMFGKKKKYSWMTGGGGSGASTPGRLNTGGLPSTPGGPVQPPAPERLTADPARRLGQWREDQTKGNGIQLRDWVAALERDGQAKKSLQKAYLFLDQSDPK